jgi:integrase
LIHFLSYTGLRWGEASALRVCDLDLMRRRAHVEQAMAEVNGKAVLGTPKDHERREVPMPPFLVEMLVTLVAGRAPDALVFPAQDGVSFLRSGNFRNRVFDAAAVRAGVGDVTPHGLRHTAASLAVQAGASVVMVQRMLGHSSPTVTFSCHEPCHDVDQQRRQPHGQPTIAASLVSTLADVDRYSRAAWAR